MGSRSRQRFYSGFEPRTKHGDAAILKSQHWLSGQRERAVTVADIARHAGLEPRTFLRRFAQATGMKPSEYQQRLRMTRAREMLEFSRSSVEEIAASVGYEDARAFRRVFTILSVSLRPTIAVDFLSWAASPPAFGLIPATYPRIAEVSSNIMSGPALDRR